MELFKDINLINIAQMKVINTDDGMPVLYKYGDKFNVDTKMLFTIDPMGTYQLVKRRKKINYQGSTDLYVYASLNYVYFNGDEKSVQTIETYMLSLDKQHTNNTLFESENTFEVDSAMLPKETTTRYAGRFELSLTWNNEKNEVVRQHGVDIPIPVFEQFGLE